MKHNPPSGVIGPSILGPLSARPYRLPENMTVPAIHSLATVAQLFVAALLDKASRAAACSMW